MIKPKHQKILATLHETGSIVRTAEIVGVHYVTVQRVARKHGAALPKPGVPRKHRTREEVDKALLVCRGNMSCTARHLGIVVTTLYRIMGDIGYVYRGSQGKTINVDKGE